MKTIWLVTGVSGQYSDRRNWNIKAFDTEAAAVEYKNSLILADQGADELEWGSPEHEAHVSKMQQLDQRYGEYDKTFYWIEEIEYVNR